MSEGLTMSQLAEKNAQLVTENAALQQRLTYAQEALNSAWIEADTVQEVVMELKDKLTLVREQRDSELNRNTKLEAKLAQLDKQTPVEYWVLDSNEEVIARRSTVSEAQETVDRWNKGWVIQPVFARPSPAIDLNAVRAEGADLCVKALVTSDDDDFSDAPNICAMVSTQLRAGNAGKDGV